MDNEDALVEALAALAHAQWSGWHRYLVAQSIEGDDGQIIIPPGLAERWQRQMDTPYALLPDEERESDRVEARRVLALLAAERERTSQAARKRVYIILAGVLDSLDQAEHLTDRIMALMAGKEET